MKLEILIPTLNRSSFLLSNLRQLAQQIQAGGLHSQVALIVSDNASNDDTAQMLARFAGDHSELHFQFSSHPQNMGLEANALSLLERASADYILWLGDDDYLPEGYLAFCLDTLAGRAGLGCIIPGLGTLYKDGTFTPARLEEFQVRFYEPGFETMRQLGHFGHQMSGLVLRREGLLERYLSMPALRNIYLFVFFVLQRCLDSGVCYCPFLKVKVNVENPKYWSYDELGLLNEVFKSYRAFAVQLGEGKTEELILEFTRQHSWRLGLDPKAPVRSLVRCLRYIWRLPLRLRGKFLLARLCLKETLLSAGMVRRQG